MSFTEKKIGKLDCIEVAGDPEIGTIVLLHGFGSGNSDLVPLSRVFKGPRWIFPNGPVKIDFGNGYIGNAWFHIEIEKIQAALKNKEYETIKAAFSPDLEGAADEVREFFHELNIPHNKLVLGGFSQGAILAAESALSFSDQIQALLLFSGILVHEEKWKKEAPKHEGLPFFMSHGRNDDILPYQMALDLEKLLVEGGLKGKMHEFNGGHEIPFSLLLELQPFLSDIFTETR